MKNEITKQIKSEIYTITQTGEAFISQTKVAELCGVAKQSIQKAVQSEMFGCQLNLNNINQLSDESAFLVVGHYAGKGNAQAVQSLKLIY